MNENNNFWLLMLFFRLHLKLKYKPWSTPKSLSLLSSCNKVRTIMVSKKLAKKILNAYYDLRFPGSFGGVPVFRKSLQKNRGITISQQALQRLLKSSLHYQVNVTKAKRFKTRPFYSRGVGIEGFTDLSAWGWKPFQKVHFSGGSGCPL